MRYEKYKQRGSVMAEAVLVMPLLMVVFALVVFFGFGMMRYERDSMMDRYAVWRDVVDGPGASTSTELNKAFLNEHAEYIDIHRNPVFPSGEREHLQWVMEEQWEIPVWQNSFIADATDSFVTGKLYRFHTKHPSVFASLSEWRSVNHHGFVRIDHEWKFANGIRLDDEKGWMPQSSRSHHVDVLRDHFYEEVDYSLETLENAQNEDAARMRNMYRFVPAYRGPVVWKEEIWQ